MTCGSSSSRPGAPNYCHIQSCSIKYALSSHLPAVAPAVDEDFIRSTFLPLPRTPLYYLILGQCSAALLASNMMKYEHRQTRLISWLFFRILLTFTHASQNRVTLLSSAPAAKRRTAIRHSVVILYANVIC